MGADGLIVQGQWVARARLVKHYVCRHCRARIGPPLERPDGSLDFAVMTCAGENRHVIATEGDVLHENLLAWLQEKEYRDGQAVAAAYPWLVPERKHPPVKLYGDEDFGGFE